MSTQWPGGESNADFESLARQYWSSWGNAMRGDALHGGAAAGGSGAANWQDAIDWWTKLAHGGREHDGREEANAAVERFNAQARNWYGQMQQVAAQFAGQDAKAADITAQWKRALGAIGENPFPEMFKAMRGHGAQGLEQWIQDASPYLEAWRREGNTMLGMPTFGVGREQQERWQKLAKAQIDCQQHESAYNALMLKATQHAYELFEAKLAEREEPGRQLTSARALFDLWIDAAEEAYAGIALSPEFREVYGARVNAQMRVRQGVQGEVERMSAMFGMPTRSDLDAAFRKISDLERAMRKMRDELTDKYDSTARSASEPASHTNQEGMTKPAASRAQRAKQTAARPTPKPVAGIGPGKGKQR